MTYSIRQLGPHDVALLEALNSCFGEAFGDLETYTGQRPSAEYQRRLLARDSFVALAAMDGETVVGGLAAYELHKFEREWSEMYIYDLAVLEPHRRQGIATALIRALGAIADERGAWVMFVQADTGEEDAAAIALYSKLGVREEVLHFDIAVSSPT